MRTAPPGLFFSGIFVISPPHQVDMSSQPNSVISRTPESPRTPIAAAAADHLHVPASKFNGGSGGMNADDAGMRRSRMYRTAICTECPYTHASSDYAQKAFCRICVLD
jgi:hypothetical protein